VENPRVLIVTPATLSSGVSSSTMRQTPTLPYQPADRGVPHSPDMVLSTGFCREKLKKKIELCGNDHRSLRDNHNFAMCMHALATFHCSFDPIKLVHGKGYFYPCHGQHPMNGKLWKATECLTYCVKQRRIGLVGYCEPCDKNIISRLEGAEQERYSTRPYSTMTPKQQRSDCEPMLSDART
jgi:hypothetical protein